MSTFKQTIKMAHYFFNYRKRKIFFLLSAIKKTVFESHTLSARNIWKLSHSREVATYTS